MEYLLQGLNGVDTPGGRLAWLMSLCGCHVSVTEKKIPCNALSPSTHKSYEVT